MRPVVLGALTTVYRFHVPVNATDPWTPACGVYIVTYFMEEAESTWATDLSTSVWNLIW